MSLINLIHPSWKKNKIVYLHRNLPMHIKTEVNKTLKQAKTDLVHAKTIGIYQNS